MTRKLLTLCIGGLLAIMLAACDVSARLDSGTPTPVPTGSVPLASDDDIAMLKEAVANTKGASTLHLESNVNLTDVIVRDVDQANNRSRYTRCIGANLACSQVTTILTETYTTTDGGQTYKRGDKGNVGMDALNFIWNNLTPEKLDRARGVLRVGIPAHPDTFGGRASRHYTVAAADLANLASPLEIPGTDGTFDIWITEGEDPVVLQVSFVGRAGFNPFEDKDLIASARWSKINEPITIEPPPADKVTP
jgi:hypothetical protein